MSRRPVTPDEARADLEARRRAAARRLAEPMNRGGACVVEILNELQRDRDRLEVVELIEEGVQAALPVVEGLTRARVDTLLAGARHEASSALRSKQAAASDLAEQLALAAVGAGNRVAEARRALARARERYEEAKLLIGGLEDLRSSLKERRLAEQARRAKRRAESVEAEKAALARVERRLAELAAMDFPTAGSSIEQFAAMPTAETTHEFNELTRERERITAFLANAT